MEFYFTLDDRITIYKLKDSQILYFQSGLTTMNYALDFLGTVVKFKSNNNIRSATDFDLSAKLALPVLDEVSMKFSYSQYVKDTETHSFSGAVSVKQVCTLG